MNFRELFARVVPPSVRFELRERASHLKELAYQLRFWHWRLCRIRCESVSSCDILFLGTGRTLDRAVDLIGGRCEVGASRSGWGDLRQSVLISDIPTPGAYRVPVMLNTVVPLGRTLEEISASYRRSVCRLIRGQRQKYSARQVLLDAEIDAINRNMLEPFASARHGDKASQLGRDLVHRIAQSSTGRLDLVHMDGEPVACCLGSSFVRTGKNYWSSVRFGYPETVFSDGCRLRKTNAMVAHLALEWAIDHGFDFFSIGLSMARPDGGLLQWKKHRAGVLDPKGYYGLLYIRLPRRLAPDYLWTAPLFALENEGLALHLGVPDHASDEAVLNRYREMDFKGLSRVCLHGSGMPRTGVIEQIRGLFPPQECPLVVFET